MNVLDQPCAFKLVYQPRDHYINDHCLVRDAGGTWHLFYIYFPFDDRRTHVGEMELGIGHAVSADLLSWRFVDICLREEPDTWENDAIYAPYVAQAPSGEYVMLYCGVRERSQQIGAAVSEDLYDWRKYDGNPVIRPNPSWSNWRPSGYHSCRDAHILEIEPGQFACYYTANTLDPDVCCIAAARSGDLLHWEDCGPVYTAPVNHPGPGQTRMESPGVNVVPCREQYMLHFTHRWGVGFVTGEDPLRFTGEPARLGPYHACEILQDPESQRWFITSCCQSIGAIGLVGDWPPEQLQEGRGLFLAGLTWIDDEPVVVDLKRFLRWGGA